MKVYTVQKGDTMWKISKTWGISLEQLIAANPQIPNPDQIDVGTAVNIPINGMSAGELITKEELTAPIAPVPTEVEDLEIAPAPTAMPTPAPAPVTEQAYPSVPKWEGLWKYVVKHGDDAIKIAKQVGVTIEMLKAANPQLAHTLHLDKIYPGQVLNIPSTGMKPKNTSGMTKEQLTAPIQPLAVEQPTTPKEMDFMEKVSPLNITPPPMPIEMPMPAPAPMPAPQIMPHIDLNLQYAPHKDSHNNTNINWQLQNIKSPAPAPAPAPQMVSQQVIVPEHHYVHQHHPMVMMYIPVTTKKKHHKKKCHKKVKAKKCGCHKHQQHHHHAHDEHMHHHNMMMAHMYNQQTIGMQPKTFYRDED
ncbi:LysM peptidoglycan-binding domain-containing protein [Tumebacillus permanentifrigoris]|uniref:LysM domain-containing protein n=1 Tax=Tumebacillus permanentifrigoris TaxID=378543 RepID=A0A316D5L1_9BACL|nr:LysM peptidoglycan-binding domain-containing protein [Tumebacillus permanentifrigoris]PWK08961.1 LysM domain-containing protein [Tumebacillus permanentifrigoris]